MLKDEKIEPYYQARADEFVNMLFDKRFLADDCSMKSLNDWLKQYVGWWLQSQITSAIKVHDLTKRIREPKRGD